jgi:hypothetical protein
MLYLTFMFIAFLLLGGFIGLTHYETEHQVRFFGARRRELDILVERVQFVFEHVDLGAFIQEEIRRLGTIAGHAIVNLSLQAVRVVERLLTRLVRYLRTTSESMEAAPRESTREFVKTLSDFKDTLKSNYPVVPEVK